MPSRPAHGAWPTALLLCLLGGTPAIACSRPSSQAPSVPLFETGAWTNTRMPGRLLLRRGGDGRNLLLTMRDEFEDGSRHRAVYEYDPTAQRLRRVPDQDWDARTNPVTECFSQSQQPSERLAASGEKPTHGGHELPLQGKSRLSSAYSPSGRAVAVLSADGPREASFMPFLGGGQNAKGLHYHQLFSVADGRPLGALTRLPFTTERQAFPACWSVDEQYVFYRSLLADQVAIVRTGLSNER